MSVILKYKEWLAICPDEARWVYDLCESMPKYEKNESSFLFGKKPKRIDAREARIIIREEGLSCICNNEHGKIYA
jgi:hypothetical protein